MLGAGFSREAGAAHTPIKIGGTMRTISSIFVGLVLLFTLGCGGKGNANIVPGPTGIAGSYEFVATSTKTPGSTTLIEANLTANGAQSTASGPSQVQTATYSSGIWYVNGACPIITAGNSVTGTVSGSNISVMFNEGGNSFTGQGTVSGTAVTGTYSGSGVNCTDVGTFTGLVVPALSGTYTGTLNFATGSDQVSATLTEGSGNTLTVQAVLTGTDNGTFTFTGSAVANVLFVTGTVNGNSFSLFGYRDRTGAYTGTANSIAVFDDQSLTYEGLLVGP